MKTQNVDTSALALINEKSFLIFFVVGVDVEYIYIKYLNDS